MSLPPEIPTPWKITDTGSAFVIKDARGRSVAWVYYRREDALRDTHLGPDEAREMAKAIARLSTCDLVLIEGYKRHAMPKLEIHRTELGKPVLYPGDPNVVGLATDAPAAFAGRGLPVFALDAYDAIATFVEERAVYAERAVLTGTQREA